MVVVSAAIPQLRTDSATVTAQLSAPLFNWVHLRMLSTINCPWAFLEKRLRVQFRCWYTTSMLWIRKYNKCCMRHGLAFVVYKVSFSIWVLSSVRVCRARCSVPMHYIHFAERILLYLVFIRILSVFECACMHDRPMFWYANAADNKPIEWSLLRNRYFHHTIEMN